MHYSDEPAVVVHILSFQSIFIRFISMVNIVQSVNDKRIARLFHQANTLHFTITCVPTQPSLFACIKNSLIRNDECMPSIPEQHKTYVPLPDNNAIDESIFNQIEKKNSSRLLSECLAHMYICMVLL